MSMVESRPLFKNRLAIVVMGVSGCGKSTIAESLSNNLKLPYLEGDEFHSKANVEKMSNGIALNDDDRWPWLESLGKTMQAKAEFAGGVVTSCSALKRSYRTHLSNIIATPLLFVYIDVSRDTLLQRLQGRDGHYMPTSLLDSQLATLEVPTEDEFAMQVNGHLAADEIMRVIISELGS